MSGPDFPTDRHWWVNQCLLIAGAKFSVDDSMNASSLRVCRRWASKSINQHVWCVPNNLATRKSRVLTKYAPFWFSATQYLYIFTYVQFKPSRPHLATHDPTSLATSSERGCNTNVVLWCTVFTTTGVRRTSLTLFYPRRRGTTRGGLRSAETTGILFFRGFVPSSQSQLSLTGVRLHGTACQSLSTERHLRQPSSDN